MKQRKPIVRNDLGKIIREIDVRPLDQRIKSKRISQSIDATEQLLFDDFLPDLDDDVDSMLPDYVRKHQKSKSS